MPINQDLNIPIGNTFDQPIGRIIPAPENHLNAEALETARKARRSFMGKALAMGAGIAAASKSAIAASEGEDAILKLPAILPAWGRGLRPTLTACPVSGSPTSCVARAPV